MAPDHASPGFSDLTGIIVALLLAVPFAELALLRRCLLRFTSPLRSIRMSFSLSCRLAGRGGGGCVRTGVSGSGSVIGLEFRILGAGAVLNKLAVTFSPLGVDKSSVKLRNGLFLPSKSLGGGMKESRVPRDEVSSPLVSPGVVRGGKDMELDEGRAGVADRPDPGTGVVTLGVTGCGVSGADEDGGVGGKSWALFWLCNLNEHDNQKFNTDFVLSCHKLCGSLQGHCRAKPFQSCKHNWSFME